MSDSLFKSVNNTCIGVSLRSKVCLGNFLIISGCSGNLVIISEERPTYNNTQT